MRVILILGRWTYECLQHKAEGFDDRVFREEYRQADDRFVYG